MISLRQFIHIGIYSAVLGLGFPVILLYIVITSSGTSIHSVATVILGLVVTAYSAYRLMVLSWRCPEGMLRIVFFIFVYIWVGLAPLYQLAVGAMPWRMVYDVRIYEKTYFVIYLALMSFEAGYAFLKFGVRKTELRREVGISNRAVFVFSASSILSALYFGPITTPLHVLLSYREEVAGFLGDGPQMLIRLSLMRLPIYVALLVVLWKVRIPQESTTKIRLLFLCVLPVFFLVNFPTAVSRAWLGAMGISIAVVVMLTSRRRQRWNNVPLIICFALVTLFPFMHRYRRANYEASGSFSDDIFNSYSTGDFDVFSMTAHFINYVQTVPEAVTWGRQLFGALLFFVPRALWSDKPVGSGYHVAESLGFPFLNVSAPFWAEGLINFGLVGVVLFMAVLGVILRRIDGLVTSESGVTSMGVLFAFFSGFLILVMRGDLMTVMTFTMPIIASVLALRALR